MTTHSLSEWAAFLSLGVSIHAAFSAPYFLLVDADHFAWPRPLTAAVDRARPVVWDVSRSEAVYPLLREWDDAKHTARELAADLRQYALLSLRETALTVAALLALLLPAAGGTR